MSQDRDAGTPWITRLPFPVHVVERVETLDRISRNRFVTRYRYHHGYFDGVEREFRGFGRVEQWDTEEIGALRPDDTEATNIDAASYVPPVHTRTWFHTGAYLERPRLRLLPAVRPARPRSTTASPASRIDKHGAAALADTVLPAGFTLRGSARGLPRAEGLDAAPGDLRARRTARTTRCASLHRHRTELQHPSAYSHRPATATRCSSSIPARRSAYHYERNPSRSAHRAPAHAGSGRLRQRPAFRHHRLRAPRGRWQPSARGPDSADATARHLQRKRVHELHRSARRVPRARPERIAQL